MSESIETAIEAASDQTIIAVPRTAAVAVLSLATYGGVELTRKAVAKANVIRRNRKARKALKEQQTAAQS